MPPRLSAVHARFGTPWVAILVSSIIYTALAALSFRELIVINMWLYSLSLVIELAAFVWLRLREPELSRPWRLRGGTGWAIVVAVVPSGLGVFAMATAGWANTVAGIIAAATGPLFYVLLAPRRA
jgi:amino acid transporter